jgi:hypothetical protein
LGFEAQAARAPSARSETFAGMILNSNPLPSTRVTETAAAGCALVAAGVNVGRLVTKTKAAQRTAASAAPAAIDGVNSGGLSESAIGAS